MGCVQDAGQKFLRDQWWNFVAQQTRCVAIARYAITHSIIAAAHLLRHGCLQLTRVGRRQAEGYSSRTSCPVCRGRRPFAGAHHLHRSKLRRSASSRNHLERQTEGALGPCDHQLENRLRLSVQIETSCNGLNHAPGSHSAQLLHRLRRRGSLLPCVQHPNLRKIFIRLETH